MTKPTGTVVARFGTLCGAVVTMTQLAEPTRANFDHEWACAGCGQVSAYDHAPAVREGANTHAGKCRSLPQPK